MWKKKLDPSLSVEGKIEVFVRHCVASSISLHKKRFENFSHECCYRNLLNTIDLKNANLTFFLDVQNSSLDSHFLKGETHFPVVLVKEGSEAKSFLALLNYIEGLKLHPDTVIYFLEDDYLHREGWTDVLLEGFQIPQADYITLYDHRDKYFLFDYRKLHSQLFITRSCHWRTTPSTTQTFAVRMKTLLDHLPIHRRFSEKRTISADHDKFIFLQKKKGAQLISSIPGWSTHAEPQFASPCVVWEPYLKGAFL
jgi:hypothetical protein